MIDAARGHSRIRRQGPRVAVLAAVLLLLASCSSDSDSGNATGETAESSAPAGTDDLPPLPDDVALSAYYVCAEALSNVAKHAPGASARVTVTGGRDLTVEVSDDGPGGAEPTRDGGLRGLSDRVEALGGWLAVTTDEAGTCVVAQLPLGTGPSSRSSAGS